MKRIAVAWAGLSLLCAAAPVRAEDVAALGWLAGAWRAEEGDGRWAEEWWTPPRGGMMIGAGINGRGETARGFEHMRIAVGEDNVVTLFAMPDGAPATLFRLVHAGVGEALFENPAHDYPQRIHYRRESETLVATISTIDGGEARTWRYKRSR